MEIRMRSAVSRTAKGYSIESTLDMGDSVELTSNPGAILYSINALSVVQIAELQKHMAKLGEAFPRGDA